MSLPERLLTERRTADMLGTTPGTLTVARARGVGAFSDLPWVKIGRAVRYRLSDVLAWIDEHTHVHEPVEA